MTRLIMIRLIIKHDPSESTQFALNFIFNTAGEREREGMCEDEQVGQRRHRDEQVGEGREGRR